MKNTDDKVLIRNYGRQQSDIFKVLNDTQKKPFKNEDIKYFF